MISIKIYTKKLKEKLHKNYAKIAKNHKKLLKTQNTKKRKNYQKNKKKWSEKNCKKRQKMKLVFGEFVVFVALCSTVYRYGKILVVQ